MGITKNEEKKIWDSQKMGPTAPTLISLRAEYEITSRGSKPPPQSDLSSIVWLALKWRMRQYSELTTKKKRSRSIYWLPLCLCLYLQRPFPLCLIKTILGFQLFPFQFHLHHYHEHPLFLQSIQISATFSVTVAYIYFFFFCFSLYILRYFHSLLLFLPQYHSKYTYKIRKENQQTIFFFFF